MTGWDEPTLFDPPPAGPPPRPPSAVLNVRVVLDIIDDTPLDPTVAERLRARIVDAARQAAPRPVARQVDPWTSAAGAAQIEPSRRNKAAAVLDRLRAANGGWVNGEDLLTVGGAAALRRCRELRTVYGWPIERRPHPEGRRCFQYRLAG